MGIHFHWVVETPPSNRVDGMRWLRNLDAKAERYVAEEPNKLGWVERDMTRRRKSDPVKLAIAARLRRETKLTLKVIAVCLRLESPNRAKARLRNWGAAEAAERKAGSPRQDTARKRNGCAQCHG